MVIGGVADNIYGAVKFVFAISGIIIYICRRFAGIKCNIERRPPVFVPCQRIAIRSVMGSPARAGAFDHSQKTRTLRDDVLALDLKNLAVMPAIHHAAQGRPQLLVRHNFQNSNLIIVIS